MNGGSKRARKGSKIWLAFLLLGVIVTGIYFLVPVAAQNFLYPALAFSSAVVVALGILLNRPPHVLPWCLLVFGPFLGFLGDVTWFFHEALFGTEVTYPSFADALYLAQYLAIIVGVMIIRRLSICGGRTSVIDPLIVAMGLGLLSWVLLMEPYADDKSLSFLAKAISISYPLCNVLVLTVLMTLMFSQGRRVFSFYLLSTSLVLLLAADIFYGYQSLEGVYVPGGLLDAGWLLSYVLFGAAALHPSMRALTEAVPSTGEASLTSRRLILLASAALVVPVVLLIDWLGRDHHLHIPVIVAGSALMFSLVVLRMHAMMKELSKSLEVRESLHGELEHQALHDALTGLANRALFSDRLEHALFRGERLNRQRLAVLVLDLDNFKCINDTLGHDVGDELLISVADRLRACVRPPDTVARLGGDEFAILLEEVPDVGVAIRVAQRILDTLEDPHVLAGKSRMVMASIGIRLGPSGETEDLLRDADAAMYVAKDKGKMRYELFEPGMRAEQVKRVELEAELTRALENEEFAVHYQPIVALETGRIVEVEALVRWEHPERGLVSPAEFAPAAEESGLIVPIGRWVLQEACRRVRSWQLEQPRVPELRLSVNLSAMQFEQPSLVADVSKTLQESGLDPCHLKLEITEHTAIEAAEFVSEQLKELKALGVGIALDDFGTGYSALNRLRSFPVDTLKIDRSFIDGMGHDLQATSIVGAVIALARSLDLSVVAEGTETEEQLRQLGSLGCDLAQGYYFSEPLTQEDMLAMLKAATGEGPTQSAPEVIFAE